jgi:predicted nucleic-acid-binding Zn-ribbon protein
MDQELKLKANFCCAKCHGKNAVTRRIQLSRGLPELLNLSVASKHILLTCTLCGYTEFYSTSVYAQQPELNQVAPVLPPGTTETL